MASLKERLDAIIDELNRYTPGSTTASTTGTQPGPGTDTEALPGDSRLDWVGDAVRGVLGELSIPQLTADDFGGLVQARTRVIVVIDVEENGLVVPGSLIWRQSSGYTAVDLKIEAAIRTWRFQPDPGST